MRSSPAAAVAVLAMCLGVAPAAAQTAPAAAQTTPPPAPPATPIFSSTVIVTTPLAGIGLPITELPSPVQTASGRDLQTSGAPGVQDFLNQRLSGVHVNEMQGNPFQPDVNYRGYTASPLLGTPQGLSVYMDGV
ncbi:MAG: TonB-dependent receptor plug domain-containing protein, partial [Acidobacteriota bacterium]